MDFKPCLFIIVDKCIKKGFDMIEEYKNAINKYVDAIKKFL